MDFTRLSVAASLIAVTSVLTLWGVLKSFFNSDITSICEDMSRSTISPSRPMRNIQPSFTLSTEPPTTPPTSEKIMITATTPDSTMAIQAPMKEDKRFKKNFFIALIDWIY